MKAPRNLPKLENFTPYAPSDSASARTYDDAPEDLSRRQWITSWICRVIAAGIMLETLFFKFTGAPESVYIFSKLGLEPWWRYGQGIWELLASVLLLTPRFGWAGGLLTLGALGAALVSHITILGIEIQGDGGLLFAMAITAFASAFVVTFIHRYAIPNYTSMSQW
jgi:putative oxidoreductase